MEVSAFREADRRHTFWSSEERLLANQPEAMRLLSTYWGVQPWAEVRGKENPGNVAFALQEYTIYLERLGRFQMSVWEPQRGIHQVPDTVVLTISWGVIPLLALGKIS